MPQPSGSCSSPPEVTRHSHDGQRGLFFGWACGLLVSLDGFSGRYARCTRLLKLLAGCQVLELVEF